MITNKQVELMAHALGIAHYTQASYRNYFSSPTEDLEGLVALGYMSRVAVKECSTPFYSTPFYYVTPEGEQVTRQRLKPEGLLQCWCKPAGARVWHWFDLTQPVSIGDNFGPWSGCSHYKTSGEGRSGYCYQDLPVPRTLVRLSGTGKDRCCRKCFRVLVKSVTL